MLISPKITRDGAGLGSALLALLLLLATGTAFAQSGGPRLVDRIVAIVDEEAILQSDLDREVELFRMEKEYSGEAITADPATVRHEMLERLIESKLIIAAAKQADMTVDEEVIQESVDEKIQQFVDHFGSLEALERELGRSGMTIRDYRTRMSTQMRDQQYLRLVVGRFLRPDIEVMENEVRDYYLANLDEMPAEPDSLTIANIMIPVQPSVEVRKEVQVQVAEIRKLLDAGEPFDEVARNYSRGPNAKQGGVIGVVAPGDLFDRNLDRAVFALEPGQVSEPVVSTRGVHLIRLDGIEDGNRRAISQVFFPIEVTQADVDAARSQIETARNRVVVGESFSLVASEMSGDPASARNGGLLGTFLLQDLSEQFQSALTDATVGQVTEPVLTNAGWYIFLVQERVDGHMYTYEELHDNLYQMVEAQKIELALADYVASLRSEFFIDEKN